MSVNRPNIIWTMKFSVGLLSLLLALTFSQAIGRETDDISGNYKYEGQVLTSMPTLKKQFSGFGLKADIAVIKSNQNAYKMILSKINIERLDDTEFPSYVPGSLVPLNYTDSVPDLIVTPLRRYVSFERNSGLIEKLSFAVVEEHWSINIKKGILSMLSIDNTVSKTSSNENITKIHTGTEDGYEGKCKTTYQVSPLKSEDLMKVSKIRHLDECEEDVILTNLASSVEVCENCHTDLKTRVSHFSSLIYTIEESKKNIVEVFAANEIIVPASNEHNIILTTTQKLTYNKNAGSPSVPSGKSSETRFTTTLKHLTSVYQPMEFAGATFDDKRFSLTNSAKHENLKPSVHKISHPENTNTLEKLFVEKMVKKVVLGIKHVGMDLLKRNKDVYKTTKVSLSGLVEKLAFLPEEQLEAVYKQVNVSIQTKEAGKVHRKILLDTVSVTGTAASIKFLMKLVSKGDIRGLEIVDVLSGFQELYLIPNEYAMNTLEDYCVSQEQYIVKNPQIQVGVCLGLAQVIKKTCMIGNNVDQKFKTFEHCVPQNLRMTIKALEQRLKTATKEHKAILLQTLAESGTVQGLEVLKSFVHDRSEKLVTRVSVLHSLRYFSRFYPQEVISIVLPIYNNRNEHPVVRVAAASTLLSSSPPMPILERMAVDLARENDTQVGKFVSLSFWSLANATLPCLRPLALNISKVIDLTPRFPKHSQNVSYRSIYTLIDPSREFSFLSDSEAAFNKTLRTLYAANKISLTTRNKFVNVLESKLVQNNLISSILEKLLSEPEIRQMLPERILSILEKMSGEQLSGGHPEREGELFVKVFQRTLYSYVSVDNVDSTYKRLRGMVLSILDKMTNKQFTASTTYVKVMLPLSSFVHIPTRMGYPVNVRQTNEFVFSLGLENIKIKLTKPSQKRNSFLPYSKIEVSGTVKPL